MVCQCRWMVVLVWVSVATAAGDQYEQQSETRAAGNQDLQVQERSKRQDDQTRPKRDYIQWYGQPTFQQPNFQQSIFQQPYPPSYIPSYQITSRGSYYIPIWGNPRRIPIYFPQKPILFNPGYPVRNPPQPPVRPTEGPTVINGEPVSIGSRLGEGLDYNENGEPIWGIVEPEPPSRPQSPTNAVAPTTRRPPVSGGRPSRPPTPPLLHRPSLADRDTPQPPPSSNLPSQSFPPLENSIQFRPQGTTTTTTTTPRPRPTTPPPKNKEEPNRCVWAIISCCNPTNNEVRYNCFEQLGCPGAFWDSSPCSRDTVAAAFSAAAKFYE